MTVRFPRRFGSLWLLLMLGLVAMAPGLIGRITIEQSNTTYELSMPDADLATILHAGIDPDEVYGRLQASGLGSVAVEMRTVADLEEAGEIVMLSRPEMVQLLLMTDGPVSDLPSGGAGFIALIDETSRVLDALSKVDPSRRFETVEVAGREFHLVSGSPDLEDVPIGYDDDRVRELTERGIEVIARVPEDLDATEFLIDELGRLERDFGVHRVFFPCRCRDAVAIESGDRVPTPDSPEKVAMLAGWLRDHGFIPLLLDFEEQEGTEMYVRVLDRGIRLHSIDLDQDLGPDLGVDRVVRAVKERNIRIILVRPNETVGARDRFDELVGVLSEIRAAMPDGFRAGVAEPFEPLEPTPLLAAGTLVSSIAIAALAGSLLGALYALLAGAATAVVGMLAMTTGAAWIGDPFRLGIAILSAVLALYVATPRARLRAATVEYLKAGLVIFAGGFTVVGLAYGNEFLLNADDFWGVKALLLAPLVIGGVVATYQSLGRPAWSDARNVVSMRLEAWHLAALAAAGFVIWYLLLRSGNAPWAASSVEVAFRQELENLLYLRPRTKEFLIGFPALLAGIVLAARTRHGWWLYAMAAIGTASAIDSFTHFHTPLLVSMLRTGLSLALGLALGLAALAVLVPVERWIRRTHRFRSS